MSSSSSETPEVVIAAPAIPTDFPGPLRVHVEADQEWAVVAPEGELDLYVLPELAAAVAELRAAGVDALRLDLRRLTFMDSSGLRFVLELSAAHRAGELRLAVVPGPSPVQRLFELTSAGELVPFDPRGTTGPVG